MKILKKFLNMAIYTSLWEKLHMLMVKPWNARELEELTSKCRGVKTGKGRE